MESLRSQLHTLIGNRERAEKRWTFTFNSEAEGLYKKAKKDVEDFLKEHPEMKPFVETVEDHFYKILYK
ncbi:MAG: hypothetical protein BWY51_00992 [Parcubacteria group bacterium ADurb.Bin316]|nr:MAG: hypothetical protein BWY51_00992 [Parcubacteria group bacterium ADurb.Bin316]